MTGRASITGDEITGVVFRSVQDHMKPDHLDGTVAFL